MGVCDSSWLASSPLLTVVRRRPVSWKPPCSLRVSFACCSRESAGSAAPRYNPNRRWRRGLVPPPEPVRCWTTESDVSSSMPDSSADGFVVVSFNILGDDNSSKHHDLYSNIPFNFLNWDWRKGLIFQEICRWNAGIVCLQEVDRYADLFVNMKKEGYDGSFKKRTGEAMDGCAMFWKEDLFHLLEVQHIEFKSFGLRDNVAQLCVFEMCRADSRKLLVGNIHVLFNPNRGDIKLGQIRMLLRKAHALSEKWGSVPVVLAGDFNSTPESAIYKFLTTSELNINMHDRRFLSGQKRGQPAEFGLPILFKYCWTSEELKNATGNWGCTELRHPLKLQSSYASVKGSTKTRDTHGEPLATTYHSKFIGTVDYLWYSDGLAPLRVLETLSIDMLRKTGGLPNKKIGSDHLALACEFIFTDGMAKGWSH